MGSQMFCGRGRALGCAASRSGGCSRSQPSLRLTRKAIAVRASSLACFCFLGVSGIWFESLAQRSLPKHAFEQVEAAALAVLANWAVDDHRETQKPVRACNEQIVPFPCAKALGDMRIVPTAMRPSGPGLQRLQHNRTAALPPQSRARPIVSFPCQLYKASKPALHPKISSIAPRHNKNPTKKTKNNATSLTQPG